MKLDTLPPPGGKKLVVIPSLYLLEARHLLHPDLVWWSYGQALDNDLEIPDRVCHLVMDVSLLAENHQESLVERARQKGITEVYAVRRSRNIVAWVQSLPCPKIENNDGVINAIRAYSGGNQRRS